MDPEIKRQWVEALRSGQYQQGRETLSRRQGDTREDCCLGVLCDLAVRNEVIPTPATDGDVLVYGEYGDTNSGTLPQAVVTWAGLTGFLGHNPGVSYGDEDDVALSQLNDAGFPFALIADLIEEQL